MRGPGRSQIEVGQKVPLDGGKAEFLLTPEGALPHTLPDE